jgi:hypothetical protein
MSENDREALALQEEVLREDHRLKTGRFSPHALRILRSAVLEYTKSLIIESEILSSRGQVDLISGTHVRQAADNLVKNSTRHWLQHVGTMGGLLLGVSLSNTATMVSVGQYSTTGVVVSAVLGVIGAFGIAVHFAKD